MQRGQRALLDIGAVRDRLKSERGRHYKQRTIRKGQLASTYCSLVLLRANYPSEGDSCIKGLLLDPSKTTANFTDFSQARTRPIAAGFRKAQEGLAVSENQD